MKDKKNTKEKILNAASEVVLRYGATGLTLDQTAKEAGVSKGGLLYHFPSKDALLRGMIERSIADFEDSLLNRAMNDPDEKGRFLRAYLMEAAAPPEAGSRHEKRNRLQSALTAAIAIDKSLLDPLRQRYKFYQEQVEKDGIDPIDATIIRFATDAMWMSALYDLPTVSEEMNEKVLRHLIQLSYGNKGGK